MSEQECEPIKCYKCGSKNWRCWDERDTDCYDAATDTEYRVPVGYLACNDCGASWTDGGCERGDQELVHGEWQ